MRFGLYVSKFPRCPFKVLRYLGNFDTRFKTHLHVEIALPGI